MLIEVDTESIQKKTERVDLNLPVTALSAGTAGFGSTPGCFLHLSKIGKAIIPREKLEVKTPQTSPGILSSFFLQIESLR